MVPAARSAWAWLYHRGYIKALFSTTTPTTTPSTITYFYSHMTNATRLKPAAASISQTTPLSLFLSYAVLFFFFFSSPHLFLLFFSPPTILPLSQLLLKESRALIREVSISFDLSLTLIALCLFSPRLVNPSSCLSNPEYLHHGPTRCP